MSKSLNELFAQIEEHRDANWEFAVLNELKTAHVHVLLAEPQPGPDGFSYLLAETTEVAGKPLVELCRWLADHGIGLVLNPRKTPFPDYVLTYGQIWYFCETGEFQRLSNAGETRPENAPTPFKEHAKVELTHNQQFLVGKPSAAYIPEYVQKMIRHFLFDQGVIRPSWAMLSQDQGKSYDLAFSLESLNSPPDKEHSGILEALSWFLPGHVPLCLVSEKSLCEFFPI